MKKKRLKHTYMNTYTHIALFKKIFYWKLYEYVFLSPVFNSISKYDYPSNFAEEELLQVITPQLEAREPYYLKADYIIQAPVKAIAEEDDQHIAEMLYKLITKQNKL